MKTHEETLKYLNSFVNYEETGFDDLKEKFNLDKLRGVLEKLGNPHRDYDSIHVAGTKGKGSICAFTSSILEKAGYRVGLFTSPHLLTAGERIKVNNKIIKRAELIHTVNLLREHLGPDSDKRFSFFEVYTLIAILYFSVKKVDFAVFETGMGGRLDATNVIDAKTCGISPVSYDHMHVLGRRIEQIAREKSAIIKQGAHCISSPQRESVLRVLRDRCRGKGATLSVVEKDITYRIISSDEMGNCFDVYGRRGCYRECRTGMLGDFQVANSAAAIGICEQALADRAIDEDTFRQGIERAFIPGRLEVLCHHPLVVIDGAQNGDSAMRLRASVEQIFTYEKLILLLGLSRDKDIKAVCGCLVPFADEIVLTRAAVNRSANPHLIRGYIKNRRVRVTGDVREALGMAFDLAGSKDLILATGSFFLIAEVRRMIPGMRKTRLN